MRHRLPPWLVLLLVAICGGIIFAIASLRARKNSTANLLSRLPYEDAVVVNIDFGALRRARVLELFAAPVVDQEPEYRAFVAQTGFDYVRDLDSALVSFHRSGTYFLLRGRFDWKVLNGYILQQGGSCHNSFCRVRGSTPERNISYFPLHPDVMALAVGPDEYAATTLQASRFAALPDIPADPVWSLIPAAALKDGASLPSGTRMFARALEGAQRIALSLSPDGSQLRLQLDVSCRDADSAAALTAQLRTVTTRLRELIALEHQAPNPRDLSGVLTAGSFEQKGRRVLGHWPVSPGFLQSLTGGAR